MPPIVVTLAQIHWFRLRRSGLVEAFESPEETAARLIGVPAQLPVAAELAMWNRCTGCTQKDLAFW